MTSTKHHSKTRSDSSMTVLVEHLVRYRLTEPSALTHLPAFSGWHPGAIHRLLRDAERQRLVGSAPLHRSARYWFLDVEGAERAGLPEHQCGPLSEVAKLRAYAVLRFCCHTHPLRHRLTAEELKQQFPILHRPGLPSNYYYDPRDDGRIGLLRIDAGRQGRWDRSLQSLRQDISSHMLHGGFRKLVAAGRFRITLVTVLLPKAERLYEALMQYRDARRIPVEIVTLPELLPLVTPRHRKEVSGRRSS